jgi:DNA anti-recombination protein RmuC
MADTILQILMWAVPSGGIGAAIAWIANKNVRQAKTAKEVHDTYKTMYADVSEVLMKVQKENEKLNGKVDELSKENERTRRSLNRLCRAIEAIQLCPHRTSCPVRGELSLTEDDDSKRNAGDEKRNAVGQHRGRDKVAGNRESSDVGGDTGNTDGQPP